MKHYIRVTAGPYSGSIYEFETKKDALVLARAMEQLRPYSTDYGNDRDGFPETRLKGRRALVPPTLRTSRDHARKIESPITGRAVFAAHERDHHITTAGRLALSREQFALPPRPEEKRRGIKGRLPIDTLKRARNALARAKQMQKRGDITVRQLNLVQHRINRAFPEIHVSPIED